MMNAEQKRHPNQHTKMNADTANKMNALETPAQRKAFEAGYNKSMKPHYWDWLRQRDCARYKTDATRRAFDFGCTAALREKYATAL